MKGISPMLAVILLIAFTVAIGGLLSVWITSMTKTQTGVAGAGAEKLIACSKSVLDIGTVYGKTFTPPKGTTKGDFNVTVTYYAGSEDLYNFTIYLTDSAGNVGKATTTDYTSNNPMEPGEVHTFVLTLDKNLTSSPITKVRVTAVCQETEVVTAEETV